MSARKAFQFTLGPVQGFVAQARRTRDFWAGSFILSWLAGVAMRAVQAQDGKIVFPVPGQDYLRWIDGSRTGANGPKQGGVPNRFLAEVPDGFRPEDVIESVRSAWRALAETVWEHDLAGFPETDDTTRVIWDRQIDGFWEISWVFGDEANLLDRRKNWRSRETTVEPGVKCMVMDGWQELSGALGPLKPDALRLEQFWRLLHEIGARGLQNDLADGEYLCAIAFVKRRFARHFEDLRAQMPNGWTLHGWHVPSSVPSVQYLAAAHWLEAVIERADETRIKAFCDVADRLGERGESATRIACINKVLGAHRQQKPSAGILARLDGGLFFRNLLENAQLYPDQITARRVVHALGKLTEASPTPFYAVLLMDGDSLGVHMGDAAKRPKISKALERFTGAVQGIVEQHNGFLIYAGGDDVLALLPLEDALTCALALRQSYLKAFPKEIPSTLSGAIEFAHVKMPLTRVLRDSHALLDDVAKDGRGRDAIAVRVWKPGGEALSWAMPWACALVDGVGPRLVIDQLAGRLRAEEKRRNEPGFSSKFLYKVRERFALVNPKDGQPTVLGEQQALTLLAVDYLASGVNQGRKPKLTMDEARMHIQPLLEQCRPVIRDQHKPQDQWQRSARLEQDGAMLARFLVQKGVER